jgi:hypothetical protein
MTPIVAKITWYITISLQISFVFANNLYWLYKEIENRAATNIVNIFFLFSKFWKIYEIVGINLQP